MGDNIIVNVGLSKEEYVVVNKLRELYIMGKGRVVVYVDQGQPQKIERTDVEELKT